MAKTLEKEQAIKLRKCGESISTIAKILKVSKGTVSYWCKDIPLTPIQKNKLIKKSKHAGRAKLIQINEQKRVERLQKDSLEKQIGAEKVKNYNKRDLLFLGIGLYWGEGYKTPNTEFGFTNSDPHMIQIYMKWLLETFNIKTKDLILRVSINEIHKKRSEDVENFWSRITQIPKSQFTKISLIQTKTKKQYANPEKHYGTLRIKVRRGKNLRNQILGIIEEISK